MEQAAQIAEIKTGNQLQQLLFSKLKLFQI